jgi:hypothetical protein
LNGLNYLNRLRPAFYAFFVVKSLSFGCGFTALLSARFFSHKIARENNLGAMAR